MQRIIIMLAALSIFLTVISSPAKADNAGIVKIDDAVEVLDQTLSIPERGIPPALLGNAEGIAIIPGVIKAGFILGGRYGKGILVVRQKDGSWSNPVFITVAGGSIGWQIGVESIDIILVFKSSRSVEGIMKGKFTLGADASVAAGPVGRQASASTDILLKSEIYSYSRSRGLFAGLALDGAGIQINHDANEAFYGTGYALPADIIGNKKLKVPPVVDRLQKLLNEHASGTGTPQKMEKSEGTSEKMDKKENSADSDKGERPIMMEPVDSVDKSEKADNPEKPEKERW
ncbi:MAG: lipid-binding SYLF domain-containing protein [Thermodesulfovibrionales bacterium]